jgi:acyl-CoA synthetase (AMP-forming)/AMP-acid ligase II/acyl carrier protein
MTNDVPSTLLALAERLSRELDPKKRPRRTDLDASLDRDWGFDSLSRAELLLRVARSFGVELPERLLREADSLRDILDALPEAARQGPHAVVPPPVAAREGVEPVPEDVSTLTEVLDWHAHRHGGRDHLIIETDENGEHLTYGELAEAARRVAWGLRQSDVSPGDCVAIMLPTGRDFFCAFYGALYAGAVPVPIYPPARPAQIGEHLRRQAGILRNAGAVALVAHDAAQPLAQLLGMQVPSLRSIRTVAALAVVDACPLPGSKASDTALIQYTSGSTGDPKGVVLTHANLLANIRAMGTVICPTSSDVFVSWLPLYHDMGLIGAWLGSLHYGVPLIVMSPQRFLLRPERWLWAIHRYRGTLSAAPNFAFELCLRKIEDAAVTGLDLRSLRMVANGAEHVSPETIRRFAERFGPYGFQPGAMAPVYGLAENAVGLTFPPIGRLPIIDRVDRKALSGEGRAVPVGSDATDVAEIVACGRPLPGHQIRIVPATSIIPSGTRIFSTAGGSTAMIWLMSPRAMYS